MNGFPSLMRNPLLLGLAAIALFVLLSSSLSIVDEKRQGVVLNLGKPVRIINAYKANEQFGSTGAGLIATIPFFENVVWIDKRVRDVDMPSQQVLSTDQYRLNVDAFARYRINNPLRMYIAARTEDRVADQIAPILGSVVRSELGKRQYRELLSPERSQIMANVRRALDAQARQYGVQIVDVRIKATDPPEGAPLDAAFERMKSARLQEARTIEAEGQKEASFIRADADAQASGIYAAAFGKDADFYDFYRAMQSYEATFGVNGQTATGQSSIILSPNNDYLREFRGRR
jgi:modulator of FtsH protease HflC